MRVHDCLCCTGGCAGGETAAEVRRDCRGAGKLQGCSDEGQRARGCAVGECAQCGHPGLLHGVPCPQPHIHGPRRGKPVPLSITWTKRYAMVTAADLRRQKSQLQALVALQSRSTNCMAHSCEVTLTPRRHCNFLDLANKSVQGKVMSAMQLLLGKRAAKL